MPFVIAVTTDKVYKNDESGKAYVEDSPLGGADPYSASKACAELTIEALGNCFNGELKKKVITVRAGNVIGGGDDSENRLLPDITRAVLSKRNIIIRNPDSTRPWQHVLDPLFGYLLVGNALLQGRMLSNSYNFGPDHTSECTVQHVCTVALDCWGNPAGTKIEIVKEEIFHEMKLLKLNSGRASSELDWQTKLSANLAIEWTVRWERAVSENPANAYSMSMQQLHEYLSI
jgi:CDP-glucose 4,6-dehydratase